jgi:hypothetical protein
MMLLLHLYDLHFSLMIPTKKEPLVKAEEE